MQLILHCSVSLQLLSQLNKLSLKFFASFIWLTEEFLIFFDIFLEIIEYLKLLIQSNKGIQLVFKLNLFLFQGKLQLIFLSLI